MPRLSKINFKLVSYFSALDKERYLPTFTTQSTTI